MKYAIATVITLVTVIQVSSWVGTLVKNQIEETRIEAQTHQVQDL